MSPEGGDSVSEDPEGEKIEGGIQIFLYRQGETSTSRHYAQSGQAIYYLRNMGAYLNTPLNYNTTSSSFKKEKVVKCKKILARGTR